MGVREGYDQELLEVQTDIVLMGETAVLALEKSIQALVDLDLRTADQIMAADDVIDQMEIDIENKCVTMIARQQPLARDLRVITTGLKITTDLERIGDYAFDISRIVSRMDHEKGHIKPLVDIPRMSAMACKMVRDALLAYKNGDLMLAQEVCQADDEVDSLYSQIFRELLTYMIEKPALISDATQLIFVARFLERAADHATNIAEWVVYLQTGQRIRAI